MTPKDVVFSPHEQAFTFFEEGVKLGAISYNQDSKVDIGVIEFAILAYKFDRVLFRQTHVNDGVIYFQVLKGNGLIHSIDYYIVQDNPMDGFLLFTEYNGKRFSELPIPVQRRIRNAIVNVDVTVDDVPVIIDRYKEVLQNMV
jgi:hypothetical protein